jgi:hypothetical protein
MHVSGILRRFSLVTCFVMLFAIPATAQLANARFGVGFNTLLSSEDGFGLGFRGRISSAINADLSVALDLGISGFILNGRDDATYIVDPQASLIVTMPGVDSASYLIGGFGAYINTSGDNKVLEGPTIHFGIGWVRPLRESVLFYEIDPALVIGKNDVGVAIPFRIGIIF